MKQSFAKSAQPLKQQKEKMAHKMKDTKNKAITSKIEEKYHPSGRRAGFNYVLSKKGSWKQSNRKNFKTREEAEESMRKALENIG